MVQEKRPTAPDIDINGVMDEILGDKRKATVDKLNADNPGFVHSIQPGDVKPGVLTAKKMEVVKDAEGIPLVLDGGDVVVKQPQYYCQRRKKARNEYSARIAEKITRDPDGVRKVARPVKPR